MKPTGKIKKILEFEIKGINPDDFTVTAIVSTKKVDRDGDVLLPEAFKSRLKHYKDHPVLLIDHDYRSDKTIGKAVSVKVTDEGLEAKFKYFVGMGNPSADWAWTCIKEGIGAYSVGFIGYEWDPIEDKQSGYVTGRTFTDVELIEISHVAVPSNRGAVIASREYAETQVKLLQAVEKKFSEGVIKEPKQECDCVPAEGAKTAIEVGDVCHSCKLPMSAEQKEKVLAHNAAVDVAVEAQAKAAEETEADAKSLQDETEVKHYFETVMEQGAPVAKTAPDDDALGAMIADRLAR